MSFTTLAQFAVAELFAEDLNDLITAITEVRPIFVRKTADETVNNSAVLQNDDDLTLPVAASSVYKYHLQLAYNTGTTPDLKLNFTLPSGATMPCTSFLCGGTGSAVQHGTYTGTSLVGVDGTGVDASLQLWGLIVTDTTAGNVALQWAQNTANASDTKVKAGSSFEIRKVA